MKPRKLYTPEFKVQALELLTTGKPVPELARELRISPICFTTGGPERSFRSQPGSAGAQAGGARSEADELRDLRRDYARLQVENDILKKAAVILGTRLLSSSGK